MLRPSANHGTQRLPNDDDDDDMYTCQNKDFLPSYQPNDLAAVAQRLCKSNQVAFLGSIL